MGNASSQEEANGTGLGGFFGLIGGLVVSVVCPPLAPVAIPAGFAAHTYGMATVVKYDNKPAELKKQGSTGDFIGGIIQGATIGGTMQAGVNYKDTDSNLHLHYCPVNTNPVELREKQEIKEKYEKDIQQDIQKKHKELDKINLNKYMENAFHTSNISFDYIGQNYWYYHYKLKADINFDSYKMLNILNLSSTHSKYGKKLETFNINLYCKSVYTYLSISKLPKLIEQWKDNQSISIKKAGAHLLKAVVYGLNVIEICKDLSTEENSMVYGMYGNKMDESMKNYCCEMKNAIIELVKEVKSTYTCGRNMAILENTINKMYDEVAKYNAGKKQMCAKYGMYIDDKKYKLNIQQRAEKIEEFMNLDINTTEYHKNILDMITKIE